MSSAPCVIPDIEVLRHLQQFGLVGHRKIPMGKGILRIAADVGRAIGAQPLGRVVVRIEAYAEQVGLGVQRGVGRQLLLDDGKVVRDQRTEVGQRAARVDEGDEQLLAAKLAR